MVLEERLLQLLNNHHDVLRDPSRRECIQEAVRFREAFAAANGCLATWTARDSTGRSPKDTCIIRRADPIGLPVVRIEMDGFNLQPLPQGLCERRFSRTTGAQYQNPFQCRYNPYYPKCRSLKTFPSSTP